MAPKALGYFLATLVLGILLKSQGNEFVNNAFATLAERLVNDFYDGAKALLDWLWKFTPDGPDWFYSYKCPTWAAKYVGQKPHGKYIAKRKDDIEKLKKLFDSFEYSNGIVNVVYLVGVPGSGKTELARQFGHSVFCERKGTPTVMTLNIETPEEFKLSLAESISKIDESRQNGQNTTVKDLKKDEVENLFDKFKMLLQKRPGWLLIIDNVKDPNITQRDMYQRLPNPGESEWGTGKMLVTTQIPIEYSNSTYIRIEYNRGLTLYDATNLLLELVNESTRCDKAVAEKIVVQLELLPLSILAASHRIKVKITESFYRCQDYLSEYSAELNGLPAHNVTIVTQITGYNRSMLAALHLSITSALEVHSNVFRDFIALIGFTTVNQRTIWVKYVNEFLAMMGHGSEKREQKLNFPLVYYSKKDKLFHVHQVVSYSFRKALERTNSNESLQYILQHISHYFAGRYKMSRFKYDTIKDHYSDLLQNLPIQCSHLEDCLIVPDTQELETVITLIFEVYDREYYWAYEGFNCSKLYRFLSRLGNSPIYLDRAAMELQFKGYQALYTCYKTFDTVNGSYLAATIALRLIKKIVPEAEYTEIHTIPVSWFLLSGLRRYFRGKALYNHVSFFLLFPHYLIFPYDGRETRFPRHEESVRMYCKPDLNNSTVATEIMTLIFCFQGSVGGSLSIGVKPFMSEYYIPLGRNVRLGQHIGIISPYGECDAITWNLPGIVPGRILKFYVDYDKRVGLKIRQTIINNYRTVLLFFKMVHEMQVKMKWKDNNTRLHHQHIEVQINELLRGIGKEATKAITEMLIEIMAATIFVATNDNFQSGLELIPSGKPSLEVVGKLTVLDQSKIITYPPIVGETSSLNLLVIFLTSYILLLYLIFKRLGLV